MKDRYKWNQNEFDALVSFAFNIGSIDKLTANGTRSRAVIAEKMLSYNKTAEQLPTLRKGSRGSSVLKLQETLKQRGYNIKADGIFGDKTLEAVKAFQAENGLVVDGVVGSKTWGKLNS